ncbi:Cro/CI family transcriptional regulator [Morganella morganii]|uniref:Cro/CI family transcriptional regulator n=1 Tax=Morganella morganii TaxID=582 RepID=UPI003F24261A
MLKTEVINFFGSVTATAKALGISKSTVSVWRNEIPWKYALLAEKVSHGKLKANITVLNLKN